MKQWQEEAIKLKEEGLSGRAIARILGRSKSSVNSFFQGMLAVKESPKHDSLSVGPKVLFLDIESAPLTLQGWGLFNQNFGLEQIKEDWSILSYSAKLLGCDEVLYSDVSEKTEDDILTELHFLLDSVDFVVGHNLERFDLPKIRAKMVERGFSPYSPVRTIDTLKICKQEFKFTSNRLAYLTNLLCKRHKKSDHSEFAGFSLWSEFLKGNPAAIKTMREYNTLDVTSLEELYLIIAPWSTKAPQFEVYSEDVDMSDWEKDGYVYTNLGKYDRYKNKLTGQYKRGRVNLLTKEKRASLLANI